MSKTILVADESPTIRKIVELTFSDSEIRVACASSAHEVLSGLESVRPDLVLADAGLRSPSGYDLCRTIKTSARPVPVLLLAGIFEPIDRQRARDSGCDGHLTKPFEARQLRETVEGLLRGGPAPGGDAPAPWTPLEAPGRTARAEAETRPGATPEITPQFVDAVARRVVELLSSGLLREIAQQVVPQLAEKIVRERLHELESEES